MKIMSKNAINLTMQAVNAVLPPRCAVTGDIVAEQGFLSPAAWAGLDFIADPFCGACGFPFDIAVEKGSLCAPCLEDAPPFAQGRSALRYNEGSKALILGFKHGDRTEIAPSFIPWLKRAGQEVLEGADMLVPVPLHRLRLLSRRYNQAALIAQALGRDTGLPVVADFLLRLRHTPTQGHLKAKERYDNVKKAFALSPKHDAKGKAIVLVDDVYTTGATVKECARVLMKAGAARVNVLTVARVVRTGF